MVKYNRLRNVDKSKIDSSATPHKATTCATNTLGKKKNFRAQKPSLRPLHFYPPPPLHFYGVKDIQTGLLVRALGTDFNLLHSIAIGKWIHLEFNFDLYRGDWVF